MTTVRHGQEAWTGVVLKLGEYEEAWLRGMAERCRGEAWTRGINVRHGRAVLSERLDRMHGREGRWNRSC